MTDSLYETVVQFFIQSLTQDQKDYLKYASYNIRKCPFDDNCKETILFKEDLVREAQKEGKGHPAGGDNPIEQADLWVRNKNKDLKKKGLIASHNHDGRIIAGQYVLFPGILGNYSELSEDEIESDDRKTKPRKSLSTPQKKILDTYERLYALLVNGRTSTSWGIWTLQEWYLLFYRYAPSLAMDTIVVSSLLATVIDTESDISVGFMIWLRELIKLEKEANPEGKYYPSEESVKEMLVEYTIDYPQRERR